MPQDENKNKTNRGDTQKNPKRPKNNGNFITINNDVLDRFCHFPLIDSLKWSIFFDLIYWDNCIIKMLKCIAIDIWIPSIDERTCTQFFLSSDFIDSFSIRRTFALCSVSRQHFHRWILVFVSIENSLSFQLSECLFFFFVFNETKKWLRKLAHESIWLRTQPFKCVQRTVLAAIKKILYAFFSLFAVCQRVVEPQKRSQSKTILRTYFFVIV